MRAKKNAKFSKILAERLTCGQRKCEKEKNLAERFASGQRKCEKDKISLHKRPEVSKEKGEKANFLCKTISKKGKIGYTGNLCIGSEQLHHSKMCDIFKLKSKLL